MGASLSSEPQPFRSYAIEAGHPGVDTASCISVQTLRGLDAELRDAGVMVFRLGTRMGRHTEFGLARCVGDWGDYFFIDEDVFGNLDHPLASEMTTQRIFSCFGFCPSTPKPPW